MMNMTVDESNQHELFQVPGGGTAYAIITVKISDHEKFMEYVHGHIPSVMKYGGKFKFEGIQVEDIEHSPFGKGANDLVIIQEWPSRGSFYAWWNSEEYKPWKKIRPQGAAVTVTLTEQRGNTI